MTFLSRVDLGTGGEDSKNEEWLQNLLHSNPTLLPVEEIEPAFSGMTGVCRELPTAVGPLDNVFINENGLLTLVECKLWRNPESRRKVIGQILDYAQEISRWSYEDWNIALSKAVLPTGPSLWDIASRSFPSVRDLGEARFIDRTTRHLGNGSFLLLVVGDGIRESTENITAYLRQHAGLGFAFGLVELGLFEFPDEEGLLVQPRILAKTVEIGRLVVRAEAGVVIEQEPGTERTRSAGKSTEKTKRTLTEELFIEEVGGTSVLAEQLRKLFSELHDRGFEIKAQPSGASMKVLTRKDGLNLMSLNRSGEIQNHGCGNAGDVGPYYLERLTQLIPGSKIRKGKEESGWGDTISTADGQLLRVEDLVGAADAWLLLAEEVKSRLEREVE